LNAGSDFNQTTTPYAVGLGMFVDEDKGDFIGKEAAIAERDGNGPSKILVTLEVDSKDADASGYEPVWSNGEKIGFVTSGGYGHTTGKSLAMALIHPDHAKAGTELTTHVVGVECAAKVIEASPYDPQGKAMRG